MNKTAKPDPTLDEVRGAERLAGVAYTDAERAMIVDAIAEQVALAQSRRHIRFANSEPMATRFDPRLPGFSFPKMAAENAWSVPDAILPEDAADIAFAPLPQLGAWLRSAALTSSELTEIYLARIEKFNPQLLAFATVTSEQALAEAAAADELMAAGIDLGPLHGIPYALKDLFDTKGITTGWGAEPYEDRIPEKDAHIVTLLRGAGAVLLGKASLGALAYNDIWYGGRTKNPFNLNEGSSGSSAGSASAVAAGLCGFAIGTETLGSITSPSERCGTTGLRPTFGRVSRAGAMALAPTLDKAGPICRAVEDTAMVLGALNGPDAKDPGSIGAPFAYDAIRAAQLATGLRVGYLREAFGEDAGEVQRHCLDIAEKITRAPLKQLSLPEMPYGAMMASLYAEAAAIFEEITLDDLDDQLAWQEPAAWPNKFRMARFLSAVDHVQLDRLRYRVMRALDELFEEVDVLIGPFATGPMLVASNFTGHPCVHLRAGFVDTPTRAPGALGAGKIDLAQAEQQGPNFSVPTGISLWGPLFDEPKILAFGQVMEQKLGVATRRPSFAQ